MSDDEIKPPDDAIELSEEELENVAGGFDLLLNVAFFRQSTVQGQIDAGGGSSPSSLLSETIESAGLQILIKDATAGDLDFLSDLLGDSAAINGTD
jgi:hypothetical protein